jgi:hypothetical protein
MAQPLPPALRPGPHRPRRPRSRLRHLVDDLPPAHRRARRDAAPLARSERGARRGRLRVRPRPRRARPGHRPLDARRRPLRWQRTALPGARPGHSPARQHPLRRRGHALPPPRPRRNLQHLAHGHRARLGRRRGPLPQRRERLPRGPPGAPARARPDRRHRRARGLPHRRPGGRAARLPRRRPRPTAARAHEPALTHRRIPGLLRLPGHGAHALVPAGRAPLRNHRRRMVPHRRGPSPLRARRGEPRGGDHPPTPRHLPRRAARGALRAHRRRRRPTAGRPRRAHRGGRLADAARNRPRHGVRSRGLGGRVVGRPPTEARATSPWATSSS